MKFGGKREGQEHARRKKAKGRNVRREAAQSGKEGIERGEEKDKVKR